MKPFIAWFLMFCLTASVGYAQTCTGSLGDPIVKVDFGADPYNVYNSDIYGDLTNYAYVKGQVEDGYYSIKNTTVGDHAGGWWQTTDHTGDPGGYMMVVNASYAPGEFFRKKVTGLCPGTTYEFAAWVLNLLKSVNGIQPNITFTIQSASGTKTFDTGAIANGNPNWVQYGTFFQTSALSGDVTIIMTNNAPGGGGNDIALDDITFRACGPTLTTNFANTTAQSQNACEGDVVSYPMSAVPGKGYYDPAYQWQVNNGAGWVDIPGATSLSYTATPSTVAGSYYYRVATAERSSIGSVNCRVNSNQLTVIINKPASTTVTGPSMFCEGDPISFECAYGDTYSWTGPNGFTGIHQTVFFDKSTVAQSGTYKVTIKKNGCVTTTSHTIMVIPKIKANAGADTTLCYGTRGQLHATGGIKYQWTPVWGLSDSNIANPVVSTPFSMTYVVKVIGLNDCFAIDTVKVNVTQAVTADAGPDRIIDEGDTIRLNGKATGVSYQWSPSATLSDATVLNPVAKPTKDIVYTLFTTSGDPCKFTATDQVHIRVYNKVIIPNTFTPNNDGVNDTWNIVALNTYTTSTLQIFTRKGDLVYQTQGYGTPWDGTFNGKPLPTGVYYYKIDLDIGRPPKAGWVSIIR